MLAVADEITVMRRGTTVTSVKPADVTSHKLAELMVGSELPSPSTEESTVTDRVLLSVRDIELHDALGRVELADISFDIHAGEVLGIAGVEGNGQSRAGRDPDRHAAPGQRHRPAGRQDISQWSTATVARPASATSRRTGSATGCSWTPRCGRTASWATRPGRRRSRVTGSTSGAREDSERIVEEYDVRTPGIDTTARALSGGNQQKFIVGREMSGDPILLIASHPTRGVDVGAQAQIWGHIKKARKEGLAVLLISADLDELIGLSDTIRVLLRGRLVGAFDPRPSRPRSSARR